MHRLNRVYWFKQGEHMKTLFILLVLVSCNAPKGSESKSADVNNFSEPQEDSSLPLTTMPDGTWTSDCTDNYSSSEKYTLNVQGANISIQHVSYSTRTCDAGTHVDTVSAFYNRADMSYGYSRFMSRFVANYSICAISNPNPSIGYLANIDNINCQLSWESIPLEIYEVNGTYELHDIVFQ